MAELKTFLFTDIVGSVELKREMPGSSDAERDQSFIEQILTPHRLRIERDLAGLGGRVVSTAGDGHFLVFSDTILAARWAIGIQASHRDEPIHTPKGGTVAVRISMHLGIPQIDPRDPNNFVGKPVDYAARLNDYATGGQILVSRSVVAVLEDAGMDGVRFHRHGKRELKGIGPVEIYELVYDAAGPRDAAATAREFVATVDRVAGNVGADGVQRGDGAPQRPERPGENFGRTALDRSGETLVVQRSAQHNTGARRRVGNYVLEERLGSGGMGDVFRARHLQFGRARAVKIIKQHFVDTGHDEVIRRFYQEIKAVGALEHPNIVVAIDSSSPDDTVHYLVMEYINGIGADELVARHGPLPVPEACEIARQAARGLAYIHQHGMVHRDIKPSNLMLTLVRTSDLDSGAKPQAAGDEQAVVKILDLGLALLVGDDQQRLTLFDNRAMGTAMYMSPEQWKTTTVDIRADIYSLGCTLYHLLAGQPPFWESDLRPEKVHEREQLPPLPGGRKLPEPLWELLKQMTAKKPEERNGDPAEVAAALAPLAEGHQLARLVRQSSGPSPLRQTRGFAKGETQIASSAESDTRLGGAGDSWSLSKSLPPASRRKLWRVLMTCVMLAGLVAIGWLAIQATGRRESAEEARLARQQQLQVAARFASSEILKEINSRFDILKRLASDDDLRQRMLQIDRSPNDRAAWDRLEDWLGARKADHDKEAPSDSWFIDDSKGIQVARSPSSDASRGENYAYRDYFHGQGADLPKETKDLKPIDAPHLSAVYRSTSTGHLKVSFSVPIENGRSRDARKVIGVLAMSVDLGEFNVLEKQLPPGQEVVLIDLRESTIDDVTRRGLILHHQHEAAYSEGEPLPWVGEKLLTRIDEALTAAKPQAAGGGIMLTDYRDEALTGEKLYWGAMQPVIDRRADEEPRDIRWLVIVQEPVSR